jgi:hypothetical protein
MSTLALAAKDFWRITWPGYVLIAVLQVALWATGAEPASLWITTPAAIVAVLAVAWQCDRHVARLRRSDMETFTMRTVLSDGARVAIITCPRCGGTLVANPGGETDAVMLHIAWHEQTWKERKRQ